MDKVKDCNTPHGGHSSRLSLQQGNVGVLKQKSNHPIEQCLLRHKGQEMVPPDGGWGFFIIVGGFVTLVCVFFPAYCFSILYYPIFKSSVSSSKIAWIMSFRQVVTNLSAIFVGPVSAEFGWRNVAIVGGILNFLSFTLLAFITHLDFLFFSFGFLGGISSGVGINLTYIVISRYFLKRRGFALAITTLGSCLALFISPVTANYLLEIYGYRGASLIMGALLLNQCVAGTLFQPVEWHLKSVNSSNSKSKDNQNEKKLLKINQKRVHLKHEREEKISLNSLPPDEMVRLSFQDSNILRKVSYPLSSDVSLKSPTINTETNSAILNAEDSVFQTKKAYFIFKRIIISAYESILTFKFMRVKIICIGAGCFSLGYVSFQMWIPFVIRNAGYSLEWSAWCVSVSSITNVMGRILMSFLSDRKWFSIKYGYMLSSFLFGLSIIAFSVASEMKLFISCVCCWGLGIGISYSLGPIAYMATVGVQTFPAVLGVSSLFIAIFNITFLPIVGIIHDVTSSYTYALSFLGGVQLIGVVAWLFMPLAIKYDKKRLLGKPAGETQENV